MKNPREPKEPETQPGENGSINESNGIKNLDNEALEYKKRESDLFDSEQRRSHRTLAIRICLAVLVLMVFLLIVVVNCIFISGYLTSLAESFQIVAFVTPITSITLITVTLLVGAFRVENEKNKEEYLKVIPPMSNHIPNLTQ